MRWIVFIILLGISQIGLSQFHSWSTGTLDLHIVPLTLIDANPRLRLGAEYHPHSRLGYSLEVGVGNTQLNQYRFNGSLWGQDYSFFEIRPEVKYYKASQGKFNVYYAAELFYLHMHDKLSNEYYYPAGSDEPISFSNAYFDKHKFGLQIKIGNKILLWNRLIIDYYGGLGIAHRHINYSNVLNPEIVGGTICEFWLPPCQLEGDYFLIQPSLGLRIGYIINKW